MLGIIDYLNAATSSTFSATQQTVNLVAALLETHPPDDLRAVIDCKAAEWRADARMAKFLRPSTLFKPAKFDEYLAQAKREGAARDEFAMYD